MDEQKPDQALERLQRTVELLSGRDLLDRCSSISVGADSVQVTFGMPRARVADPTEQPRKRMSPQEERDELFTELARLLPGARLPRF